jgi:arylsulfatase A-like enzyme
VAVTAADAWLLERSKSYFRGTGFLSDNSLSGPGETTLFLAVSLLVDAAFIGFVMALVSRALRPARLTLQARLLAGFVVSAGGLIAYDAASYQALRFLGADWDLQLFIDLLSGRWSEIWAVSREQIIKAAVVGGAGVTVAVLTVVVAQAITRRRPATGREPVLLSLVLAGIATIAVAAAATQSDVLENGLLRKPAGLAFAGVVNKVTDVDRDGFGVVGRSSDPDPFDASVYPYAVDVPGNGRDEDGVAGDLPAGTTPYADAAVDAAAPWVRRPDVVLVVLESFRADLVGGMLEGKPITPTIDALAARGYASPAAYSHNGYTFQSRFHIYTGTVAGKPGSPTLIDDFKAHGYQVAYFSGQDESFGGPHYSIGFDRADAHSDARTDKQARYTSGTPGSMAIPMTVVEQHVSDWVGKAAADRPLLLCVNFHDTHFPYTHAGIENLISSTRVSRGEITPENHDRLWATYANTAANVDRAIGQVLATVRAARGREPGIIVTSDHGESLFDEGFLGHGYALNEAQTRVPFVVVNLPMVVPEPLVQSEIRPALLAAMQEPDGNKAPGSRPRGSAPLFQYLGDLGKPREVGFVGHHGRLLYDFRSDETQKPGAGWLRPANLPKAAREEFVELVQFWERIQLARYQPWRKAGAPPGDSAP